MINLFVKSWLKAQHSENKDDGIWSHHFMGNRWGNSVRLIFLGSKITADGDCSHEIIVNEAKIDAFLELSCFFYDPVDVGNVFSVSNTS